MQKVKLEEEFPASQGQIKYFVILTVIYAKRNKCCTVQYTSYTTRIFFKVRQTVNSAELGMRQFFEIATSGNVIMFVLFFFEALK